jgi:lipoprotein-anchoring transpeptidase ErfK/SrfK
MRSLVLVAALAVGATSSPAGAFQQDRPIDSAAPHAMGYQSQNANMPFPALMNALFGAPPQARAQGKVQPQTPPQQRQQVYAEPSRQLQPVPGFVMPGTAGRPSYANQQPGLSTASRAGTPGAANVAALQPPPRTAVASQARQFNPAFERRQVAYNGPEKPGTIIINTNERFLYLIQDDGTALRYGVGVGRPGFEWRGTHKVTRKAEWPDWTPPPEMRKRQPGLPAHMKGGPNNPLGARALYLGSTLYRIHGSNEPWSIGQAVSSGCIRMRNEDVIDLYERVKIGTTVKVI